VAQFSHHAPTKGTDPASKNWKYGRFAGDFTKRLHQTLVRKGPKWLLPRKAATSADMFCRPLMTRSGLRWSDCVALRDHCCPVDGGYDSSITLQDEGF
jgi:hypothetical protein